MAQMPQPQDQQAPQDAQAASAPADITSLAQQVGQGLAQLSEAMSTPDEKEKMANILSMYVDLMDQKLGAGAEQSQQVPAGVPIEGGAEGIPGGPQSRM